MVIEMPGGEDEPRKRGRGRGRRSGERGKKAGDVPENLREIAGLMYSLERRNRAQHARCVWFRHFRRVVRALTSIVEESEKIEHLGKFNGSGRAGKDLSLPYFPLPVVNETRKLTYERNFKDVQIDEQAKRDVTDSVQAVSQHTADLGKIWRYSQIRKAKLTRKRNEYVERYQARIRWLGRTDLWKKCYNGLFWVIGTRRFAGLGIVLMACLAEFYAWVRRKISSVGANLNNATSSREIKASKVARFKSEENKRRTDEEVDTGQIVPRNETGGAADAIEDIFRDWV